MPQTQSYSLFELNEYLRRVIALNFNEAIWIKAEIFQIKPSRGNYYLELVEKAEGSNDIIAQMSAVIWVKSALFIKRKLGELQDAILSDGTQISVKVRLDFNERYGLKLIIEDIDPSYTMGQLELIRQKIIQRLKAENLIHLNGLQEIPAVVQRVAVISSKTAAGYQDFMAQLRNNPYGYQYRVDLFQAAMQGKNTEKEVLSALHDITDHEHQYDLICIIRGGGSKMDLAAFDNYNIAHAISQSPLPVLCGIGHDIDQTIADIVAHIELKTPTAVADFLIEHNLFFESEQLRMIEQIKSLSMITLQREEQKIIQYEYQAHHLPQELINRHTQQLALLHQSIHSATRRTIDYYQSLISKTEAVAQVVDPKHVLKRGFAMIKKGKTILTTPKQLQSGDKVEIEWDQDSLHAIIE